MGKTTVKKTTTKTSSATKSTKKVSTQSVKKSADVNAKTSILTISGGMLKRMFLGAYNLLDKNKILPAATCWQRVFPVKGTSFFGRQGV